MATCLQFPENRLLVARTFSAFRRGCCPSFVCIAGLFPLLASWHSIEAERLQVQHWVPGRLGPLMRVMLENRDLPKALPPTHTLNTLLTVKL